MTGQDRGHSDWKKPLPQEERERYTAYYEHLTRARLTWVVEYVHQYSHQPAELAKHVDSLFTILRQAHTRPALKQLAVEVIASLHPWPLHWERWGIWEQELAFAVDACAALSQPKRQAEFQAYLTNVLFLTGRQDEALSKGQGVIDFAHAYHAVLAMAEAGVVVTSILIRRGRIEEAEYLQKALEREIQQAKPHAETESEWTMASAHLGFQRVVFLRRQNRYDDALLLADQIVAMLEALPECDPNMLADAYAIRANIWAIREEFPKSVQDLSQAINSLTAGGYLFAASAIRGNLGLAYWSMGELDLAESTLRQSIALSEKLNSYWRLMIDVGNLALVHLSRGQFQVALSLIERHLKLANSMGDVSESRRALYNRSMVYLGLKEYELALPGLEEYRAYYEPQKRTDILINIYIGLSDCYAGFGQTQQATELADQALSMARQIDLPSLKVLALRCWAEYQSVEEQVILLRDALELARQYYRPLDAAACLLSLAGLTKDEREQSILWEQGVQLLEHLGAMAWLEGCSYPHPPHILMYS